MKQVFPCHEDRSPLTEEEIAAGRENLGRQIEDARDEITKLEKKLYWARRKRDAIIRGYIGAYDGTIADAAKLASLDRSSISKILYPNAKTIARRLNPKAGA
ncbi:hypothetical protein [Corynebacterium tuberculostearicum]|uniref:hypothetical protein n=1 Tax=Corynebacterium tuberculostearicum TaxID=38304 RepID=UPI0025E8F6EB|nr:hypothetical protein [Corynebacterium tuberculostearicum]WKE58288.1 hypothetical protein J8247_05205 [Corynebacterium tuberculostearicum]